MPKFAWHQLPKQMIQKQIEGSLEGPPITQLNDAVELLNGAGLPFRIAPALSEQHVLGLAREDISNEDIQRIMQLVADYINQDIERTRDALIRAAFVRLNVDMVDEDQELGDQGGAVRGILQHGL